MKILFVGDSEAGAVGPYASSVTRPGETVSVASVVGSRVEAWANGQLAQAIAQAQPDVVVVFLGTNNYYDTSPPNLTPLLAQLPARTVWVGPTSVQGKAWPINGWLKSAVTAAGLPYVDTESLGIPLRDGIHPTPAGAKQWLQAIWPYVEQEAVLVPSTLSGAALAAVAVAGAAVGVLGYILADS